ncbi:MAG: hypothetical protein ABJC19_12410 [Gemmatimonadota bacterium]
MWSTSRPAQTAEWQCTRCGVTNRKLVPTEAIEISDRCVTCGLAHTVHADPSPVRWRAAAA